MIARSGRTGQCWARAGKATAASDAVKDAVMSRRRVMSAMESLPRWLSFCGDGSADGVPAKSGSWSIRRGCRSRLTTATARIDLDVRAGGGHPAVPGSGDAMRIDGQCHCGAITYEAEIDPAMVTICHCTDCQTLSGTVFRTAVPAPEAGFTITGQPKIYVKTGDSGAKRAQAFCADCGSPLYASGVGDGPKVYMIRVGTARQRDQLVPQKQIWCRSEQDWLAGLGTMRKLGKQA
jgi:hypothetical protein